MPKGSINGKYEPLQKFTISSDPQPISINAVMSQCNQPVLALRISDMETYDQWNLVFGLFNSDFGFQNGFKCF